MLHIPFSLAPLGFLTMAENLHDNVQLGPPWFRHPIVVSVCTGPEPSSPSVRACLFVGSIWPPSSVTRCDSSDRMLVMWPSNDRMHAFFPIPCVPSREGTLPSRLSCRSSALVSSYSTRCSHPRPLAATVSLSGLTWVLVADRRVSRTGVEDPPLPMLGLRTKSILAPPRARFRRCSSPCFQLGP